MEFVDENKLKIANYENYPFHHTIIDNFLKDGILDNVLSNINNLKDDDADSKFISKSSPFEYNKYAFTKPNSDCLNRLFV